MPFNAYIYERVDIDRIYPTYTRKVMAVMASGQGLTDDNIDTRSLRRS